MIGIINDETRKELQDFVDNFISLQQNTGIPISVRNAFMSFFKLVLYCKCILNIDDNIRNGRKAFAIKGKDF